MFDDTLIKLKTAWFLKVKIIIKKPIKNFLLELNKKAPAKCRSNTY
jgi:hypothetical protein